MSRTLIRQFALAPLLLLIGAVSARAADLVVTQGVDGQPGSLRAVIASANPQGGDTITFDPGAIGGGVSWPLAQGPLVIDRSVTIIGPGFQYLLIHGPGSAQGTTPTRIFVVNAGVTATIKNLSISGGVATEDLYNQGGGIHNSGNLTLEGVYAYDNRAEYGGAVYSAGVPESPATLTIRDSQLNGNIASNSGGALYVGEHTSADITDSTFHGNGAVHDGGGISNFGTMNVDNSKILSNTAADGHGGGIANNFRLTVNRSWFETNVADTGGGLSGVLADYTTINRSSFVENSARNGGGLAGVTTHTSITNSTISQNSANGEFSEGGGGIWFVFGTMTLSNVTLHNNSLGSSVQYGIGGGIANYSGTLNIKNSILSIGSGVGGNLANDDGTVNVDGVNLSDDNSWPALTFVSTDALSFAAFLNYSALPPILRLQATSVAIDAANDGTDWSGNPVAIDQRGTTRPQGLRFDVGSYEFNYFDSIAPQIVFGSPSPAPNADGWNNTSVSISFDVTDEGGSGLASVSHANPLLFESEGATQYIEVTATDTAGNSLGLGSPAVSIDKTAPTSSHSVSGTTVTLSASDNLSGVKTIFYDIDGGTQRAYVGPFPLSGSLVRYWSQDYADNVESPHTIINRKAVTVSVASVNGQRGKSVTLSATVTETGGRAKVNGQAVTFSVTALGFTGTATTNSKGVASVPVLIPTTMATGTYVIEAMAQQDGAHLSGSGTGKLTIKR
jgi:hypothetical protein